MSGRGSGYHSPMMNASQISDASDAPHHPIWEAVSSPMRSIEVRAWLRKPENRELALSWRGRQGETMLHWGAMADLGLMVDLAGVGLDVNALDGALMSPADWLLERLWMTHVEKVGGLTNLNLRKIRIMTDDLLSALWRQGGRVHGFKPPMPLEEFAVRQGLWQVLATWADTQGPQEGVPSFPMHAWPLAPAEEGRRNFLRLWQQHSPVDTQDEKGCTPLFVAIQERLKPDLPARASLDLDAAIDELLEAGANPDMENDEGNTPFSQLLSASVDPILVENLERRLLSARPGESEAGLDLG